MAEDYSKLLCKKVEHVFGRSIVGYADCVDLSEAIKKETGKHISHQTLRRFFGIIKSNSTASTNTTNTLCQYIGFRDMQEFTTHQKAKHNKAADIDFTAIQSMFNRSSEYADNWIFWHEKTSAMLAEMILANEAVFELFAERMHKDPGAMQHIMAMFQMWDNLNKDWYMRGLRLFCRNSNEFHHKMYLATKEFLACLLNNKLADAAPYVKVLKENLPAFKEKYGTTLLPLEGAIYAELIIDAHFNNRMDEMNDYFEAAMQVLKESQNVQIPFESKETTEGFPINLCTKLNCYGLYELAAKVVGDNNIQENKKYEWHKTERVLIDILKATAYFQTGRKAKAKNIYDTIQIDCVSFDRKNLITIQYLLLKLGFTPKRATIQRKKIKQQIQQIIAQTGMVIFNNHISKFE